MLTIFTKDNFWLINYSVSQRLDIDKIYILNKFSEVMMAKAAKKVKKISHEEISDAMSRFLKGGGIIKKIKYNDNGFLLKNDLTMDDSYSESSEGLVGQLQMDFESESRV